MSLLPLLSFFWPLKVDKSFTELHYEINSFSYFPTLVSTRYCTLPTNLDLIHFWIRNTNNKFLHQMDGKCKIYFKKGQKKFSLFLDFNPIRYGARIFDKNGQKHCFLSKIGNFCFNYVISMLWETFWGALHVCRSKIGDVENSFHICHIF